jgi:chorismate mutase/prephenate dehydratase
MAVEKIRVDSDLSVAAIASAEAAAVHGLCVIKTGIANVSDNHTRMLVVSKTGLPVDRRVACKTSIVFDTKHERGALVGVLGALSEHELNLTKIESRPKAESPFHYQFFVEFDGNIAEPNVEAALTLVKQRTTYCKILGCYPTRRHLVTPLSRVS